MREAFPLNKYIFLLYPSLLLCDDAYGHYIPVLYSDLVNYATFFEKKTG